MRRFSGDWTRNVLRGLGMKESEAIESRMVNRRIQSELKKIAMRAMSDLPANSAEEWLERNCPR
jgi:preprotein translocase subunit SecA